MQGICRGLGVAHHCTGLPDQRHTRQQQQGNGQPLQHQQLRGSPALGRPEMANARARERQQCQQPPVATKVNVWVPARIARQR